jgi:hypothetical protein
MDAILEQLSLAYHKLDLKYKALLVAMPILVVIVVVGLAGSYGANTFSDIFQGLGGLFTVIAVTVGGFWTYLIFVSTRQRYPRASLTHQITHRPVSDNKVLLTVVLTVANQGAVALELLSIETWIQRMVPWPRWFLQSIEEGRDPVEDNETEIGWPKIAERYIEYKKDQREIEPGEPDQFIFDFIISSDVKTIVVYTYIHNHRKRQKKLGWGITSVYDLRSQPEGGDLYGAGFKEKQNR